MQDLKNIRADIDKIDRQIVALYEERMKLTSEVAAYKIANGREVFDSARELQKLAAVEDLTNSEFTRHGVHELFEHIMAMSRKKQYQLLTESGRRFDSEFQTVDTLDFQGKTVLLSMTSGASARAFLPKGVRLEQTEKIETMFERLVNGEVSYGFIEVGTDRFGGNVIGYYNEIAENNCQIVASYADDRDETRRCLLLSARKEALAGADQISICFEAPDECGALYHLLSHITYNNLNLNRIGSAVISTEPLDYRFFVDVTGSLQDGAIWNALQGLKDEARNFRIIGNY